MLALEKRLGKYLYRKAMSKENEEVPHTCAVVWCRKTAREASAAWVSKNTALEGGKCVLCSPNRHSKHYCIVHMNCQDLYMSIGTESAKRQLKYGLVKAASLASEDIAWFGVQEIHDHFAKQVTSGATALPHTEAASTGPGEAPQTNDEEQDAVSEEGSIDEADNMLVAVHGGRQRPVNTNGAFCFTTDDLDNLSNEMLPETDNEFDEAPPDSAGFHSIRISAGDVHAPASASSSSNQAMQNRLKILLEPGAYSTPERMKLLVPPVVGCHMQRRTPDGVIQAWYPQVPSKTFRFAARGQFTNEDVPYHLVVQATRSAAEWTWQQYAAVVGADDADRMFREHWDVVNMEGIQPSDLA